MTEPTGDGTSRVSRLVAFNKHSTSTKTPVKIFSMSARPVTITVKSPVCELKEVTVSASIHHQSVASETYNICEKLDLEVLSY